MRVRVVSALVALGILAVVLVFLDTLLLNAVVSLVAALAVFELLNAAGLSGYRVISVLSMLLAALVPFIRVGHVPKFILPVLLLNVVAHFELLAKTRDTINAWHMAIAFLSCLLAPIFVSCAVFIRDDYSLVHGGFYLLTALGAGWFSDTGAYFVGVRFGKHRLAPKISPKKTVEGSVGGIIACTLCLLLIGIGYTKLMGIYGISLQVNYPLLACLAPVFSIIGMLGDLSASALKRKFGIKDFGNIMPGHGGILDRFDSVMLTLPAVYATAPYMELVRILS